MLKLLNSIEPRERERERAGGKVSEVWKFLRKELDKRTGFDKLGGAPLLLLLLLEPPPPPPNFLKNLEVFLIVFPKLNLPSSPS